MQRFGKQTNYSRIIRLKEFRASPSKFLMSDKMSEIINAVADMITIIADNPASILIALGFIAILVAVFLPIGIGG